MEKKYSFDEFEEDGSLLSEQMRELNNMFLFGQQELELGINDYYPKMRGEEYHLGLKELNHVFSTGNKSLPKTSGLQLISFQVFVNDNEKRVFEHLRNRWLYCMIKYVRTKQLSNVDLDGLVEKTDGKLSIYDIQNFINWSFGKVRVVVHPDFTSSSVFRFRIKK